MKAGWEKLLTLCLKLDKKQELNELFQAMLTPDEYENIGKRILIMEELIKKESSQRQIADKLNVSIAKITRGSNELKRMPRDVQIKFEKIFNE